jgi:peptidase E
VGHAFSRFSGKFERTLPMKKKTVINTIVPPEKRHIVAMGGAISPGAPALYRYVVGLTNRRKHNPRVLFIPTPTGDDLSSLVFFYRNMAPLRATPSDLSLFHRTEPDLRTLILSQDVIFVGGGNTKSMLAVWREYGIDKLLKEAWERGTIMTGSSAGGICWFDSCVTDSFAGSYTALPCMGMLKGSCCPHYDGGVLPGETGRRSTYHGLIQAGTLSDGYAIEEVTGMHFVGNDLTEVVTGKKGTAAYRVTLVNGVVKEVKLPARLLP